MTDRPDPDLPEPTENLAQTAEPTAAHPTTAPTEVFPTAEAAVGSHPADAGTPDWPSGATPRTPFGPPETAPVPPPTPASGQPWARPAGPPPGQAWQQGQPWGPPPGSPGPSVPPVGQPWGQQWAPQGQPGQPWGTGGGPYQPPGPAYRGTPPGPAESVRSARTLVAVAAGLVVLGLFTSFIAAVTSRWGMIPTGVSIVVGMVNIAALVCGVLGFWRLARVVEDLATRASKD